MSIVEEMTHLPHPSARNRRQKIIAAACDVMTDILYYDRKSDEELPVGAIEEAILAGEISREELLALFGHAFPRLR